MSQTSTSSLSVIIASEVDVNLVVTPSKPAMDSFKDSGRVHVGGLAIRYDSIKDAGRVHVGGLAIKF